MKNRKPLEEYDLPKMKAPKLSAKQTGKSEKQQYTVKTVTDAAENTPEKKTETELIPAEPSEK